MPKSVQELIENKIWKKDCVEALRERLVTVLENMPANDPVRPKIEKYISGFEGLKPQDPNNINPKMIKTGLKKLGDFYDFVFSPQADGRTGYGIITEGLDDNTKEFLNQDLHYFDHYAGFNADLKWLPNQPESLARPDRPMRTKELQDYFINRLHTTRERVDFVAGIMAVQIKNPNPPVLYREEIELAMRLLYAHFEPWNEKEKHYNLKLSKERLDEFNQIYMETVYDLGRAYRKKLKEDYPPEKYPDREKAEIAAATEIQESSRAMEMLNLIFRNDYVSVISEQGKATENFYNADTKKTEAFSIGDYLAKQRETLLNENAQKNPNPVEREYFQFGNSMTNPQEAIFNAKLRKMVIEEGAEKAYSEYGLDQTELKNSRLDVQADLMSHCDLNWLSDDTFRDNRNFLDHKNVSDSNGYFVKYFRALDTDSSKLDMISKAAVYGGRRFAGLTPVEKNALDSCTKELFNQRGADGKLDYMSFRNTVSAYLDLIVDKEILIGTEATSDNARKLVGSDDPEVLRCAAIYTSDASRDQMVLKDYMMKAAREGLINRAGMKRFIKENGLDFPRDITNEALAYKFIEVLESKAAQMLNERAEDDLYNEDFDEIRFMQKPPKNDLLSTELKSKLLEDREKRYVERTDSIEPEWRNDPKVDQEVLDKLSNLYDQIKKEDHWYHINSTEYKELKAWLKKADDLNSMIKRNGGEITEKDRSKVAGYMYQIGNYSSLYLKDKILNRNTDLGSERYETVLSALNLVDHGNAKRIMKARELALTAVNKHFESMGIHENSAKLEKHLITMEDLEKRTTRNHAQQKEYNRRKASGANTDEYKNEVDKDPDVINFLL